MSIGNRIKQRRTELGLSMEQLGAKLGKCRSTICRYENGEIESLPLDILHPLADALKTTPAWLMGWEDAEEPETTNEVQDETYIALVRRYSKLTPAQKAVVDHLMESYISEDSEGANAG